MDRIGVKFIVMGLVALAIGVGPGDARGMIVFSDQDIDCPSSLAPPNAIAAFSVALAGSMAGFPPSAPSGPLVLCFAGTAAVSPSAEQLSHEIIATQFPCGMVPNGDSISQAGGYGIGAAVGARLEIVPQDSRQAALRFEYAITWPAGPSSRWFRPPRV